MTMFEIRLICMYAENECRIKIELVFCKNKHLVENYNSGIFYFLFNQRADGR